MADVVDVILRLKKEGATRVALHPDGSVSQVEFGDSMPRANEDQDDHPDLRPAPRRPTGGIVPRGDSDSR